MNQARERPTWITGDQVEMAKMLKASYSAQGGPLRREVARGELAPGGPGRGRGVLLGRGVSMANNQGSAMMSPRGHGDVVATPSAVRARNANQADAQVATRPATPINAIASSVKLPEAKNTGSNTLNESIRASPTTKKENARAAVNLPFGYVPISDRLPDHHFSPSISVVNDYALTSTNPYNQSWERSESGDTADEGRKSTAVVQDSPSTPAARLAQFTDEAVVIAPWGDFTNSDAGSEQLVDLDESKGAPGAVQVMAAVPELSRGINDGLEMADCNTSLLDSQDVFAYSPLIPVKHSEVESNLSERTLKEAASDGYNTNNKICSSIEENVKPATGPSVPSANFARPIPAAPTSSRNYIMYPGEKTLKDSIWAPRR